MKASVYLVYFVLAGILVIELPQPWNGYAAGAAVVGLYPLWMWQLRNRENLPKAEVATEVSPELKADADAKPEQPSRPA